MKRYQIALTVILVMVIGFIFSGFYGWQYRQEEVDGLETELRDTQTELRSTNDTLEAAREKLGDTKGQLEVSLQRLQDTKTELETTKTQLESVTIELQTAKLDLQAQGKYYEQRLEEERELSHKTGYEQGYEEGKESALPKKPTYAQAIEMSKKVQVWATSPNACTIAAMAAREEWRKEGWKVGVASIRFWGIGGHMVVVFDTVDRDEVYLDILPNDGTFREVKVEEGKSWTGQNGLPGAGFDDTIFRVITMW